MKNDIENCKWIEKFATVRRMVAKFRRFLNGFCQRVAALRITAASAGAARGGAETLKENLPSVHQATEEHALSLSRLVFGR